MPQNRYWLGWQVDLVIPTLVKPENRNQLVKNFPVWIYANFGGGFLGCPGNDRVSLDKTCVR